ncbi:MAG: type II CRISPR-associated endonuclease Cas1 [Alphaproteobacteria bacterium]|nr:type II CRISPR-associated endonuclease Cas1 [Alphaproteobacteria bacterium]
MIQKIIEVNKDNTYLSLYRGFLLIEENSVEMGRVSFDEIAGVVISSNDSTLSKNIMVRLAEHNIPLIICGGNYLPISISLPLSSHYQSKLVLDNQINASLPLKKRLWQKIIQEKIKNQAYVLQHYSTNETESKYLENMANDVQSGDSTGLEAQAARYYFNKMFGKDFTRDKQSTDLTNVMLNYGYTVLRSAVCRSLCAAGLNLSLGLFHKNAYNHFCLADDLMEPYRPLVDYTVKAMVLNEEDRILTPQIKKELADILILDTVYKKQNIPIFRVFNYISQNLVSCFKEGSPNIQLANLKL